MLSAVINSDHGLDMADLNVPVLSPNQVRVAVSLCGICGSDLHWRHYLPIGAVMGHEVVGTVVELGAEVGDWQIGDRVVIVPVEPCRTCEQCVRGRPNLCARPPYSIGGKRARGGYAESVVALPSMLMKIPSSLAEQAAALIEPLAVAIHGVDISSVSTDDTILIIGAGTIGALTALALKALGCSRIVAVEPIETRREVMQSFGIKAIDSKGALEAGKDFLGEAPAFIFECAGYSAALSDAAQMLAPGGRILLLSAPPAPVPFPQWDLMSKEADIRTAILYTRTDFQKAIDLLTSGKVPADAFPIRIFPLQEAPGAFNEALTPTGKQLKVMLRP